MLSVSVDLEGYQHALVPPEAWNDYPDRVVEPTEWLLETFERFDVQATFYVLGPVVEDHPDLIRTIAMEGHRIGSHGYFHAFHERAYDASDLMTRRQLDYLGIPCVGYRSPYWHTTPRPGYGGGAFFRILPYPLLQRELRRSKELWLHPHDLDPGQPRVPHAPWRRYLGLVQARKKLLRVLAEMAHA